MHGAFTAFTQCYVELSQIVTRMEWWNLQKDLLCQWEYTLKSFWCWDSSHFSLLPTENHCNPAPRLLPSLGWAQAVLGLGGPVTHVPLPGVLLSSQSAGEGLLGCNRTTQTLVFLFRSCKYWLLLLYFLCPATRKAIWTSYCMHRIRARVVPNSTVLFSSVGVRSQGSWCFLSKR
jgi:hypothetical protein